MCKNVPETLQWIKKVRILWKKGLYFKLKHRNAQKSILSWRFGTLTRRPEDLMKNLETPGKTGRVGRYCACPSALLSLIFEMTMRICISKFERLTWCEPLALFKNYCLCYLFPSHKSIKVSIIVSEISLWKDLKKTPWLKVWLLIERL